MALRSFAYVWWPPTHRYTGIIQGCDIGLETTTTRGDLVGLEQDRFVGIRTAGLVDVFVRTTCDIESLESWSGAGDFALVDVSEKIRGRPTCLGERHIKKVAWASRAWLGWGWCLLESGCRLTAHKWEEGVSCMVAH